MVTYYLMPLAIFEASHVSFIVERIKRILISRCWGPFLESPDN